MTISKVSPHSCTITLSPGGKLNVKLSLLGERRVTVAAVSIATEHTKVFLWKPLQVQDRGVPSVLCIVI